MQQLSPQGQQTIDDIARRHGYSNEAVLSMLQSVINGNGRMAQFNHPEFSGGGQWMSGGMTMVSDMFNNNLKSRVSNLCFELSQLVANQPNLLSSGSFQSQSQGGQQQNNYSANYANVPTNNTAGSSASLFVPPAPGKANWWGDDLRWPNSTGAQNGVRYAYFAQARRLAIELNGRVTIYDTQDHQIGGFSQQQSYGGSISFNSQYGLVDVASLPVISIDGVSQAGNAPAQQAQQAQPSQPVQPVQSFQPVQQADPAPRTEPGNAGNAVNGGNASNVPQGDIFAMIDRLADLRSRGVLSDEEFLTKKTELLARL